MILILALQTDSGFSSLEEAQQMVSPIFNHP